jgi:hypothetical protein
VDGVAVSVTWLVEVYTDDPECDPPRGPQEPMGVLRFDGELHDDVRAKAARVAIALDEMGHWTRMREEGT